MIVTSPPLRIAPRSQSIVPEVYILNLMFMNLLLLLVLKFWTGENDKPGWKCWFILGLVIGSGIFHHLSFAMVLPGFLILLFAKVKWPGVKQMNMPR